MFTYPQGPPFYHNNQNGSANVLIPNNPYPMYSTTLDPRSTNPASYTSGALPIERPSTPGSPLQLAKQIYANTVLDAQGQAVKLPSEKQMVDGGAHICWRISDGLFLGGSLAAKDKLQMKRLGITHILNLVGYGLYELQWMGGRENSYFPDEFKYLIIQTADNDQQDLISLFQQTSAFIDESVRQRGGVLVHCFAGVSRSATMMAAYLMDHRSMSATDAVALIKRGRRESQPNPNFMKQLQNYEIHLQNKINMQAPNSRAPYGGSMQPQYRPELTSGSMQPQHRPDDPLMYSSRTDTRAPSLYSSTVPSLISLSTPARNQGWGAPAPQPPVGVGATSVKSFLLKGYRSIFSTSSTNQELPIVPGQEPANSGVPVLISNREPASSGVQTLVTQQKQQQQPLQTVPTLRFDVGSHNPERQVQRLTAHFNSLAPPSSMDLRSTMPERVLDEMLQPGYSAGRPLSSRSSAPMAAPSHASGGTPPQQMPSHVQYVNGTGTRASILAAAEAEALAAAEERLRTLKAIQARRNSQAQAQAQAGLGSGAPSMYSSYSSGGPSLYSSMTIQQIPPAPYAGSSKPMSSDPSSYSSYASGVQSLYSSMASQQMPPAPYAGSSKPMSSAPYAGSSKPMASGPPMYSSYQQMPSHAPYAASSQAKYSASPAQTLLVRNVAI